MQVGEELKHAAALLREASEVLSRCAVALSSLAPAPDEEPDRDEPGVPPLNERLTSKQLGAIFGIARRHGIARDQLAGLVRDKTGKRRIEFLTKHEASELIGELDQRNGAHP